MNQTTMIELILAILQIALAAAWIGYGHTKKFQYWDWAPIYQCYSKRWEGVAHTLVFFALAAVVVVLMRF